MFPSSVPDDKEPDDMTPTFWKSLLGCGGWEACWGPARPGSVYKGVLRPSERQPPLRVLIADGLKNREQSQGPRALELRGHCYPHTLPGTLGSLASEMKLILPSS